MAEITRGQVKSGFLWNAVEKYSGEIVQFGIGIIMARLLTPDDYAVIAMITVFIVISNTFIGAGFPTTLLRKQDCTQADLSTVFFFNIVISLILASLLWVSSPWIAEFYHQPILLWVTRAMAVPLVIGSFSTVSMVLLKKNLRFKSKALITLISNSLTGIVAIIFAYKGFGVWALVIQAVTSTTILSGSVILIARWRPSFIFSISSFKELFGFGSKVLGSNLISNIYQNMYNILIGKFFAPATLGYFTRADGYSKLVPINIAGVVQNALLPMLATIQDNEDKLIHFHRKMIQTTSFLIFPACFMMAGMAYPLISVMITDKWLPTAPLMQVLCVTVVADHLFYIDNDFIMVRGHSGYVMKEQAWTKLICVLILAATIPLGIMAVAIGKGFGSFITWGFSSYYLRKAVGIRFRDTLKKLAPSFICSLVIGFADAIAFIFLDYTLFNLIWVSLLSCGIYLLCARAFFNNSLQELIHIRR